MLYQKFISFFYQLETIPWVGIKIENYKTFLTNYLQTISAILEDGYFADETRNIVNNYFRTKAGDFFAIAIKRLKHNRLNTFVSLLLDVCGKT